MPNVCSFLTQWMYEACFGLVETKKGGALSSLSFDIPEQWH